MLFIRPLYFSSGLYSSQSGAIALRKPSFISHINEVVLALSAFVVPALAKKHTHTKTRPIYVISYSLTISHLAPFRISLFDHRMHIAYSDKNVQICSPILHAIVSAQVCIRPGTTYRAQFLSDNNIALNYRATRNMLQTALFINVLSSIMA